MASLLKAHVLPWFRRSGFAPPRQPEPLTDEQLRRIGHSIRLICIAAVIFDVATYFAFRNVSMLSERALFAFVIINITLLSGVGLVVHFTQLRAARPHPEVWPWVCVVMSATTLVWIQLTGVVSSYFIVAAVIQIVLFRWAIDWAAGFWTLVSMAGFHVGAYLLEELGIVPGVSLLREPSKGLESVPVFRVAAIVSIVGIYSLSFMVASAAVNRMRAQRRELERVRREMIGLAEGAKQGRLSGTELGRWFVDELLGRGGSGEVYAAHDELGNQVAIKVLYPHLADDPRAFARFSREQEVGAEISGTYFPRLIEVARADDGSPYIVMERLRGEDLGALLRRRGTLTQEETRRLMRAMAKALDALHARGIVHRDLTPGNVFLVASSETDWPDLRILDLGMCKLRDADHALTQSSMVMGTPGYMAPEQIMGQAAQAGPETDVFAFAAILYRALTGEQAFAATTLVQAVDAVVRREPVWPSVLRPELSTELDTVFQRALAKKPEARFPTAGSFAESLERTLVAG